MAQVSLTRLFRDRSNLFFVLVFPLLLVLLIGISFGDSGPTTPVVAVLTGDQLADDLAATLEKGDLVTVERRDDRGAANDEVAAGDLDALAVVATSDTAPTVTVVQGAEGQQATTVATAMDTAVAAVEVERRIATVLDDLGITEPPVTDAGDQVQLSTTIVDEEAGDDDLAAQFAGLGRFDLGASSQLLLFVFITSLTGSVAIVQTRRWGVVDRLLAGPVGPARVIAGLGLGQLAIAVAQAVIIVGATSLLFGVRWGDPVAAVAVVLAFSLAAAAAGLLLGASMSNEEQVGGVSVPLALGLAALGGSMLPLELFPDQLRVVSRLTPHAWGNLAFAEIVRRDGGLVDVLPNVGVLLGFAVVLGTAATVLLRRRIAAG